MCCAEAKESVADPECSTYTATTKTLEDELCAAECAADCAFACETAKCGNSCQITNERILTFKLGDKVDVRRASTKDTARNASLTNLYFKNSHLSKLHASLSYDEDGFKIRDEDSTFGTVVNDQFLVPGNWLLVNNGDKVGFIVSKPSAFISDIVSKTKSGLTISLEEFNNPQIALLFVVEVNKNVIKFSPGDGFENDEAQVSCDETSKSEAVDQSDFMDESEDNDELYYSHFCPGMASSILKEKSTLPLCLRKDEPKSSELRSSKEDDYGCLETDDDYDEEDDEEVDKCKVIVQDLLCEDNNSSYESDSSSSSLSSSSSSSDLDLNSLQLYYSELDDTELEDKSHSEVSDLENEYEVSHDESESVPLLVLSECDKYYLHMKDKTPPPNYSTSEAQTESSEDDKEYTLFSDSAYSESDTEICTPSGGRKRHLEDDDDDETEPPVKKAKPEPSKLKAFAKEAAKGLAYVVATVTALGIYGSTLAPKEA